MNINFKQILFYGLLGAIYFTIGLTGTFLAFKINLVLGIFVLCFWLFTTSLTIVKYLEI